MFLDLVWFSEIDTQHRTPESIPQRSFFILLPFLSLVRWWPQFRPVLVVRIMQVSLTSTIVCRVNGFAVGVTFIRTTAVGKVRAEDEHLTYAHNNR